MRHYCLLLRVVFIPCIGQPQCQHSIRRHRYPRILHHPDEQRGRLPCTQIARSSRSDNMRKSRLRALHVSSSAHDGRSLSTLLVKRRTTLNLGGRTYDRFGGMRWEGNGRARGDGEEDTTGWDGMRCGADVGWPGCGAIGGPLWLCCRIDSDALQACPFAVLEGQPLGRHACSSRNARNSTERRAPLVTQRTTAHREAFFHIDPPTHQLAMRRNRRVECSPGKRCRFQIWQKTWSTRRTTARPSPQYHLALSTSPLVETHGPPPMMTSIHLRAQHRS